MTLTLDSIPILNLYYLLCYAWDHVQERDTTKLAGLEGLSTAQDLLGKVLASGVNHLWRRGLDRGYVERREDLVGIRGKLSASETAKRVLRARGRAACDFEELSVDIQPNQILRSSLHGLLRHSIPLHSKVSGEVRSAYRRLSSVSLTDVGQSAFGEVRLGSDRRLYRFLLSVCRLIYENSLIEERSGQVTFRDFRRDEATMWKIFEKFTKGFYEREQGAYKVNRGGRFIQWADMKDDTIRALIPKMEADLILESSERRIIMDTKYYTDALSRGPDSRTSKLRSGHLYQLLAYLRNRQDTQPNGAKHEGILLYPEVGEPLRSDIQLEGFRIQARTVNLNQDWRLIHREMLSTIGLDQFGRAE
ncbi:MAG: hypothetical protein OXH63_15120 [Gemmatimonadetes bacterium]|nr:hypothetical protein [Gemmatimonadota bacterium]